MNTAGRIIAVTLGLVILYDVLELAVKQPGVIPGAAGTFSGMLARFVSPGAPLVPYAPGYGPPASGSASTTPSTPPSSSSITPGFLQGILTGLEGMVP